MGRLLFHWVSEWMLKMIFCPRLQNCCCWGVCWKWFISWENVEQIVWVVIFFFHWSLGGGGAPVYVFDILCFTQAMCEWMDEHVGFWGGCWKWFILWENVEQIVSVVIISFHCSCEGVFMLFYILCFSQVMCGWMDGWMVVSPEEFFHLCGWITMLVF